MSRYGRSVTPAMGAMTTGSFSLIGPMVAITQPPPSNQPLRAPRGCAQAARPARPPERPFVVAVHAVLAAKALHPAARRAHALADAGVERMAVGADVDAQILPGGTGLEGRSARSARNGRNRVLRMNALLH